jgi:tRNA(His) 5'-end guanylyltransferase
MDEQENIPLDVRMKKYEHVYRSFLPRRTYTLMRLDGRAFHSYLAGAQKPFDRDFMNDMNLVAIRLAEEVQGARFAYVQSDEISLLLTDFESLQSMRWFDGNVNKLLSVSAGLASAYLARLRQNWPGLPMLDCRVWTMSDPVEVANYFVWRQRDAVRNSIQMAAQAYFSPARLQGKSTVELQEMLFSAVGVNWDRYPPECKRGRLVGYLPEEGWAVFAAPHFRAEPGTELAQLIPSLPSLGKNG